MKVGFHYTKILSGLISCEFLENGNFISCKFLKPFFGELDRQFYCPEYLKQLVISFDGVRQLSIHNPKHQVINTTFLEDFIKEVSDLERKIVTIEGKKTHSFGISSFVCDNPARNFL